MLNQISNWFLMGFFFGVGFTIASWLLGKVLR